MKVKKITVILLLACLMIINIPYLTQTVNNIKTLIIELVILLYLISGKFKRGDIKTNVPIILFWFATMLSTLIGTGLSTRFANSIVTGFGYVLLFLIIHHFAEKRSIQVVVDELFSLLLFFVVISDLTVFLTNANGIGSNGIQKYYLIGSKFFVSYLHMLILSLLYAQNRYFIKKNRKKTAFWVLSLYSVFVCYYINCNTGIFGVLVILIIGIFVNRSSKVCKTISRPTVYITVFVGLSFLLVGTNVILGNSFFQQLLTDLSHTNKILTGRVEMYNVAIAAIANNPIFGHGINNTVVSDVLTWGNAQNGLLKMLLDYGIVGTGMFIYVCWNSINDRNHESDNPIILYGVIAFLYGMAVCSMVEINISGLFFLALAIVKSTRSGDKNKCERIG